MRIRNSLILRILTFVLAITFFFYAAFVALCYLSVNYQPLGIEKFNRSTNEFSRGNLSDNSVNNAANPYGNYPQPNRANQEEQTQPDQELPELAQGPLQIDLPSETSENTDSQNEDPETQKIMAFINSPAGSFLWIVVALFIVFCSFIFLAITIGWKNNSEKPSFTIIHLFPFDLICALSALSIAIITSLAIWLSNNLYSYQGMSFPNMQLLLAIFITTDFIIFYGLCLLFVAQIKTRTIIKATLLYKLLALIIRLFRLIGKGIKNVILWFPLVVREVLIVIIYFAANIFLLSLLLNSVSTYATIIGIIGIVVLNLTMIVLVLRFFINYQKIKKSIIALANGESDYQVDEKKVHADFYEISKAVNQLKSGIDTAIDEKNKSNLFKTELITNVSHDIKTPLTSIIMYSDLLSRENLQNENARQFVKVISTQSDRLKKLIEDLIEASKISTGNITVNLITLDIKEFVMQLYADYREKFAAEKLKLILTLPESELKVNADPKYLIRVFENLFSNVLKYALPDTRIYFDVLATKPDEIRVRLRNVSAAPLNISAEQLLERFVQGDTSRSKDGSGIGLSIAKSLMEAQNGSLEIQIDGDLFTVEISLQKMTQQ